MPWIHFILTISKWSCDSIYFFSALEYYPIIQPESGHNRSLSSIQCLNCTAHYAEIAAAFRWQFAPLLGQQGKLLSIFAFIKSFIESQGASVVIPMQTVWWHFIKLLLQLLICDVFLFCALQSGLLYNVWVTFQFLHIGDLISTTWH